MLTTMTKCGLDDGAEGVQRHRGSRRGDKGRDDKKFLSAYARASLKLAEMVANCSRPVRILQRC